MTSNANMPTGRPKARPAALTDLPVAILPPALADERLREPHDRAAKPPTAMQ